MTYSEAIKSMAVCSGSSSAIIPPKNETYPHRHPVLDTGSIILHLTFCSGWANLDSDFRRNDDTEEREVGVHA